MDGQSELYTANGAHTHCLRTRMFTPPHKLPASPCHTAPHYTDPLTAIDMVLLRSPRTPHAHLWLHSPHHHASHTPIIYRRPVALHYAATQVHAHVTGLQLLVTWFCRYRTHLPTLDNTATPAAHAPTATHAYHHLSLYTTCRTRTRAVRTRAQCCCCSALPTALRLPHHGYAATADGHMSRGRTLVAISTTPAFDPPPPPRLDVCSIMAYARSL